MQGHHWLHNGGYSDRRDDDVTSMIIMHMRCQTATDVQTVQGNFRPQTRRPAVHFVGSYWSSADCRTRAGSASNFLIKSAFRHLPKRSQMDWNPKKPFLASKEAFFHFKNVPQNQPAPFYRIYYVKQGLIIKGTGCTNFSNLFLGICHTGLLTACEQDQDVPSWSCSQAVWHIPLLCVQWKTPVDGYRKCPKHVEFWI